MSRKFLFNDIRAFDPRDIRGLTLWLDYRAGVYTDTALTTPATIGQAVKGWADRSGNGYHATEATNPPTLAADGLAFDGTNDVLRVARMTGQFGGGFSYFVVASLADGRTGAIQAIMNRHDTVRSYFRLYIITTTPGQMVNYVSENSTDIFANVNNFADGASSAFIASSVANPGGNLTPYFNGTAGTPVSIAALAWANIGNAVTEAPLIGASKISSNAESFFWGGTIRALLIYNRPLTATELTQVHRYIGNTHGIAVP